MTRETPSDELSQNDRSLLGRRRAGAAITLLRQGERDAIFDALRVGKDPESLSQFVARCKARSVTVNELLECIDKCDTNRQTLTGSTRSIEDRVLYGLLLALGDYPIKDLSTDTQTRYVKRLVDWYGSDPSSAIHGASGWLLRHWNRVDEVEKIDQTPLAYDPSGRREWFTLKIHLKEALLYFTFVVFPPGEYEIGSPEGESHRQFIETLHTVRLTRPLAICDRELTWGQFDP